MPTVDTLVAQHLIKTVTAARLMGADCIISGIRPQIAQTIVHLGVELERGHQGDPGRCASRWRCAAPARRSSIAAKARLQAGSSRRWSDIPILKMGDCLLVTIQVDMHDRLAMALQDDLTQRIVADRARGVLIDISALEIVDSFIGRMLANIAAMSRVLDADTVVVGMRPAVAITLVELGLSLTGVRTALNVDKGMALLRAAMHRRSPRRPTMLVETDETMPLRTLGRRGAGAPGGAGTRRRRRASAWSTRPRSSPRPARSRRNTVDYGGGGDAADRGAARRTAAAACA